MTTVARHPSAQTVSETRQGERGFTLIELSIVLVIIGLLIGGILQGQEMINNTRQKSTVAQVDGLTAAVQTFQDKYRQLPGDFERAVLLGLTATEAGDGDNFISDTADTALGAEDALAAADEPQHVWDHLRAADLMQGITGTTAGSLSYPAKLSNAMLDIATFDFGDGTTALNRVGVRVRGGDAVTGTDTILSARDAFSLDERYDDGFPNTGRWRGAGTNCAEGTDDTDDYDGAQTGDVCILLMRVN